MTPRQQIISAFESFLCSIDTTLFETDNKNIDTMSIEDSSAEALHTVALIADVLPATGRVLEVGAGLGLTSAFLASQGYDVVALEPGDGGFGPHSSLIAQLFESLGSPPALLTRRAESLNPALDGHFDFIFSMNVLEHVSDLAGVLAGLSSVLKPGATMRHSCPNYHVPYEPHFGIPLLPFVPQHTARLLSDATTTTGIWESLNFVTSSEVESLARDKGLDVHFHPAMGAAIRRLRNDGALQDRHPVLERLAHPVLAMGLDRLIDRLPTRFCTPMIFDLRHAA